MNEQKTKRCHWVSQSYLKSFAAVPGKYPKIWRLGKDHGEPELKRIDKVAVKFHLYAPLGPDGLRDDALEKKLSETERFFGEPIWQALCNDFPDLSWAPIRKMLALIVAISYVRNPKQFQTWKIAHREIVQQVSSLDYVPAAVKIGGKTHPISFDDWPQFKGAGEEDMKAAWNDYVSTCGDLAKRLLKMRFGIMFSEKPEFITSDNPVNIEHPSLKFMGIDNRDSMIWFPLSPTRLLFLDNRHSEKDGAYWPLRDPAAIYNVTTWRNSIEHMFSPRHPDEVCAEMLKDAEDRGFA